MMKDVQEITVAANVGPLSATAKCQTFLN